MLPNLSRLSLRDDAATGVSVELRQKLYKKYKNKFPEDGEKTRGEYDLKLLVVVLQATFFKDPSRLDSAIIHFMDGLDALTWYTMDKNAVHERIRDAILNVRARNEDLEKAEKWLEKFDLWQAEGDKLVPLNIHGGGKAKIADQTSKRQKDPQKYAVSEADAALAAQYRELVEREKKLRDFTNVEL